MEAKAAVIIQKRYREHVASKYNLTEEQTEFIRPWYKRWRTKSIFQVLLLYRAERLQTIVNFCLQIHIYNQNCIHDIQRTMAEINLEEVNVNATYGEYLPPPKPTIPKLLFMWESLKLRGDIENCEKLPDCDLEQLELEIFNKLIKKKAEGVEKNTKSYEDKEIQACLNHDAPALPNNQQPQTELDKTGQQPCIKTNPENNEDLNHTSQNDEESETNLDELNKPAKMDQNAVLNITMIKSAIDNLKQSDNDPSPKDDYDNFQETRIQALRSRPSSKKIPNTTENKPKTEQKLRNTIGDMEEKFRNVNHDENNDNPPFNFKAMLKKPNHTRSIPPPDETVAFKNEINALLEKRRKSLNCGKVGKIRQQEMISVELAPGILIHGKIADL